MRALALTLLCATSLAAETYVIEPQPGARFALEVHKTGLMSGKVHVFEFERYTGTLSLDPTSPETAKIDLTIQAASIVCKDTWVDEKDKKKITEVALDMVQHASHPELKFTSTTITQRGGVFNVTGTLNIKGVAKPIVVNVTMKQEGNRWAFSGKATILRKDYKINPPSPVPFGIIGNKEEMPVSFTLIAKR